MNDSTIKPLFQIMGMDVIPIFSAMRITLCKIVHKNSPIIAYAVVNTKTDERQFYMTLDNAKKAFLKTVEPLCETDVDSNPLPLP